MKKIKLLVITLSLLTGITSANSAEVVASVAANQIQTAVTAGVGTFAVTWWKVAGFLHNSQFYKEIIADAKEAAAYEILDNPSVNFEEAFVAELRNITGITEKQASDQELADLLK